MARKIDYIRKGQLLAKGLPALVAERSYFYHRIFDYGDLIVPMYYKSGINKFVKINCNTVENIVKLNEQLKDVPASDIIECQRINDAKYHKNKRLKDKLGKMITFAQISQNDLLFLTLTFNNESLQNLTAQVRRKYVAQYLKENSFLYVGNIDFGEEFGREHYHAVCVGNVDLKEWHKFGAIKVQHIHITKYCQTVLAKYIAKLTNHALKECAMTKSNKRQVLLYQKGFDKEYMRLMALHGLIPMQEDVSSIFSAENTEKVNLE